MRVDELESGLRVLIDAEPAPATPRAREVLVARVRRRRAVLAIGSVAVAMAVVGTSVAVFRDTSPATRTVVAGPATVGRPIGSADEATTWVSRFPAVKRVERLEAKEVVRYDYWKRSGAVRNGQPTAESVQLVWVVVVAGEIDGPTGPAHWGAWAISLTDGSVLDPVLTGDESWPIWWEGMADRQATPPCPPAGPGGSAQPPAERLTDAMTFDQGIRLDPVAANAQPRLSASQAWAIAKPWIGIPASLGPGATGQPAERLRLILARYSSTVASAPLAWVVLSYRTGAARVNAPPAPADVRCGLIFVIVPIDANSGGRLDVTQVPG